MRGVDLKRLFSVMVIALFLCSFFVLAVDENAGDTTTDNSEDAESTADNAGVNADETATSDTTETTLVEEPKGYSAKKSTDWLRRETESVDGLSPFQLSLVILALNNQNVDVDSDVAVLKDPANFDSETGCFPVDNCKVSDSSMGLVALEKTSQDEFSKIKDYLLQGNAQTAGLKEGEWRLQLDVAGNGTCTITYGDNNRSKRFEVDDAGVIKGTSGKYFIDISKELDSSLIGSKISQPLLVDCADLSGVASLVYYLRKGNSYFLLDSQPLSAGMADLRIINACFRARAGTGGCDLLSSLYGTWGLVEAGVPLNEIGTLPYLESTIITSPGNDLHNAILVRILQKSGNANSYFDNLLVSKSGGSWGRGDIYTTAWVLFALQKASGSYGDSLTAATSFLEKRNKDDGSWNQNVQNTAMALIALSGADLTKTHVGGSGVVNPDASNPSIDEIAEICAGKMDDKYGRTGCSSLECKDSENCVCKNGRKDSGEEDVDCGGSCEPCVSEDLQDAGEDGEIVDAEGEDIQDDGITTPGTGTAPKSSSSLIWVIIAIILIVVAGGGAIVYLKSQGKLDSLGNIFRRKPKGPSFDEFKRQLESRPVMPSQPSRPVQRPMPSRTLPVRKAAVDEELEKSLKEAEKLLKGK